MTSTVCDADEDHVDGALPRTGLIRGRWPAIAADPFIALVAAMTRYGRAGEDHMSSHAGLLGALRDHPPATSCPPLDLICIPTSRPFSASRQALTISLDIAARLGSRLLVLCSGEARPEDFPADLLTDRQIAVAVVPMPTGAPLPEMGTTSHPLAQSAVTMPRDVAEKRNLAIWLAMALSWSYVLFVDDDICPLDLSRLGGRRPPEFGADSVREALLRLAAPGGPAAAGWITAQIWDNSVVCHARRLSLMDQDSFIGGGALLVKAGTTTPFFPKIYNEDWFFFYALLRNMRSVGHSALIRAGIVGQLPYLQFKKERAASEEVPDALAEGLFAALQHSRRTDRVMFDPSFWAEVINRRQMMIRTVRRNLVGEGVVRRVCQLRAKPPRDVTGTKGWILCAARAANRRRLAWTALSSSLQVYDRLDGEISHLAAAIVDYLRVWNVDLRRWRKSLKGAAAADLSCVLGADVRFLGPPDAAAHFVRTGPGGVRVMGAEGAEAPAVRSA